MKLYLLTGVLFLLISCSNRSAELQKENERLGIKIGTAEQKTQFAKGVEASFDRTHPLKNVKADSEGNGLIVTADNMTASDCQELTGESVIRAGINIGITNITCKNRTSSAEWKQKNF